LACKFCQNWDMSKSREMDTLADRASPGELAAAAERLGCASIAYTYNDPTVFMEYAIDVAMAARARGVRSVAVTAGYMCPEPRAEFFRHMDATNIDLKGFTADFYRKVCGAELAAVLETLEYVHHETCVWLEVTTLLIPGLNDADAELEAMCAWFAEHLGRDVPLHFTAFHPDWKMRDVPATPLATLRLARQIALRHGLRYVYTGNVRDPEGASTWCHACGAALIRRDGYAIGQWALSRTEHAENAVPSAPASLRPARWLGAVSRAGALVGLSPAPPACLDSAFRTRGFAVTVPFHPPRRRYHCLIAARRRRTLAAAPLPARGSAARSETARQT